MTRRCPHCGQATGPPLPWWAVILVVAWGLLTLPLTIARWACDRLRDSLADADDTSGQHPAQKTAATIADIDRQLSAAETEAEREAVFDELGDDDGGEA